MQFLNIFVFFTAKINLLSHFFPHNINLCKNITIKNIKDTQKKTFRGLVEPWLEQSFLCFYYYGVIAFHLRQGMYT